MKQFFPLLSLFLAFSFAAKAEESFVESWAYQEGRALCTSQDFAAVYSKATFEGLDAASRVWGADFYKQKNYWLNRGVSQSTRFLLDSASFHKALYECFGKEFNKTSTFLIKLVASDVVGGFIGMSGGYLIPVKAGSWVFAGAWHVLSRVPGLATWIATNVGRQRLQFWLIGGLAVGLTTLKVASEVSKSDSETLAYEDQMIAERLTALEELFELYLKILRTSKAPVSDIEEMKNFIVKNACEIESQHVLNLRQLARIKRVLSGIETKERS